MGFWIVELDIYLAALRERVRAYVYILSGIRKKIGDEEVSNKINIVNLFIKIKKLNFAKETIPRGRCVVLPWKRIETIEKFTLL